MPKKPKKTIDDSGRINFPPKVKKTVRERAGGRCSYLGCPVVTSGPGAGPDEVSRTGDVAHIYSASENGPRGRGGLNAQELASASNAIWLCNVRATEVDNHRGKKYPAELLLAYKQLHEARVAKERHSLYSPLGWVYELKMRKSKLFKRDSALHFAKMTLLIGENATGKSAICDWTEGIFREEGFRRWLNEPKRMELSYKIFNPNLITGGIFVKERVEYKIGDRDFAFNPLQVRVIRPRESPCRRSNEDDDLQHFATIFGLSQTAVRRLAEEVNRFEHAHARDLRFVEEDGRHFLHLDLEGTVPNLSFAGLSGREQETVLVEFAAAYARQSSAYAPTLLILDSFISILFQGWFEYFSHHFLDPENTFQTVLTLPTQRKLDLANIAWNGWEILKLSGRPPNVSIDHETIAEPSTKSP
jgi:hypothetical protein